MQEGSSALLDAIQKKKTALQTLPNLPEAAEHYLDEYENIYCALSSQ